MNRVTKPRQTQPKWTPDEEDHLDRQQRIVTGRSFSVAEHPPVHQVHGQWAKVLELHNASGRYCRTMDSIKHKWRETFKATCAAQRHNISGLEGDGMPFAQPIEKRKFVEVSGSMDNSANKIYPQATFSFGSLTSTTSIAYRPQKRSYEDVSPLDVHGSNSDHDNDFQPSGHKRPCYQSQQAEVEQEPIFIEDSHIQGTIQAIGRDIGKTKCIKSASEEGFRSCVNRSGEIEIQKFRLQQQFETLNDEMESLGPRKAGFLEQAGTATKRIEELQRQKAELEKLL